MYLNDISKPVLFNFSLDKPPASRILEIPKSGKWKKKKWNSYGWKNLSLGGW